MMFDRHLARLRSFFSRPAADQWLAVQAYFLLGITRLLIKTLPFRRLERLLGERLTESDHEVAHGQLLQARRVGWAVRSVSPYTPWTSDCFPQALTAKLLLRRRDIGSTLYLGAAFKETKSELQAHAWLRCGPLFLTGGDGSEKFGAIAGFA